MRTHPQGIASSYHSFWDNSSIFFFGHTKRQSVARGLGLQVDRVGEFQRRFALVRNVSQAESASLRSLLSANPNASNGSIAVPMLRPAATPSHRAGIVTTGGAGCGVPVSVSENNTIKALSARFDGSSRSSIQNHWSR